MQIYRTYGTAPYSVAVIHGGPGAVGEMEPVARKLSDSIAVLEPIQTATTLEGQIKELVEILEQHAQLPVTLIGFSWGAWLSFLVAAKYPTLVQKLILVGSGPYEPQYLSQIGETRQRRLTPAEQDEYAAIITLLNTPNAAGKTAHFTRLGQLANKADHFAPIEVPYTRPDLGAAKGNQFHEVLREAQELRTNGELIALADEIVCPVVAIHGDYDPHPLAGVQIPLASKLPNFRVVPLQKCGHKPWIEKWAAEDFYAILQEELSIEN